MPDVLRTSYEIGGYGPVKQQSLIGSSACKYIPSQNFEGTRRSFIMSYSCVRGIVAPTAIGQVLMSYRQHP